ncbi:MAG: hypothetical protein J1E04_04035 [Alistipes sp.]|nr:hypothetical protein [Alistipes sp.]
MSGIQTLDLLAKRGLIDRRAAEALFARNEVERLARKGRPRCLAMVQVAEMLCCSYQKVRNLIYNKEI